MLKKIVIPVDFGNGAKAAYYYAQQMTANSPAEIYLIHILNPEKSGQNVNEAIALKDLQDFATQNKVGVLKNPNNGLHTSILKGSYQDCIQAFCDSYNCDMMILGRRDKHSLMDRVLGSIGSKIAEQSNCPVLIIPEHILEAQFKNILYATDHNSIQLGKLQSVLNLIRHFGSKLHFIHINAFVNENTLLKNNVLSILCHDGIPVVPFVYKEFKSEHIATTLKEYSKEQNIDLVILSPNQELTIWEKWTHSISQDLIHFSQKPMLILNKKNL
ncbi:MAG: universal stress protein [Saprospiraceae bacterium]|jgi:nucleotide-binding universal stress UspA family protein|nr:universal stress protein [Saprospiraceae bacterium]